MVCISWCTGGWSSGLRRGSERPPPDPRRPDHTEIGPDLRPMRAGRRRRRLTSLPGAMIRMVTSVNLASRSRPISPTRPGMPRRRADSCSTTIPLPRRSSSIASRRTTRGRARAAAYVAHLLSGPFHVGATSGDPRTSCRGCGGAARPGSSVHFSLPGRRSTFRRPALLESLSPGSAHRGAGAQQPRIADARLERARLVLRGRTTSLTFRSGTRPHPPSSSRWTGSSAPPPRHSARPQRTSSNASHRLSW